MPSVRLTSNRLTSGTSATPRAENKVLNLQLPDACDEAARGCDAIYNLAADMGGMGFIEKNKALCMLSVLVNTHLLMSARKFGTTRYFYSSSACVYAADKQTNPDVTALKEEDAYPAMPEDGYGWEKLFSERMCRHFTEDFGLVTRVARYHNVYGPLGTYAGRPRKGARRHLPQGDRGQALRQASHRDLGATASKPAASSTSTTASRARR